MDAFGDTLAKAAGWPSEFGELGVSIAASRSHRRGPRWQAEGVENLSGYDRIVDGCQNAHPQDKASLTRSVMAADNSACHRMNRNGVCQAQKDQEH